METSTVTLTARELSLNKSNVGQDSLQKTQEEFDRVKTTQLEDKPVEVRRTEADKQGHINIYA